MGILLSLLNHHIVKMQSTVIWFLAFLIFLKSSHGQIEATTDISAESSTENSTVICMWQPVGKAGFVNCISVSGSTNSMGSITMIGAASLLIITFYNKMFDPL